MSKFDIFLSYQWDIQDKVKELQSQLVQLGFSVWMDIFQMAGGNLHTEIVNGIKSSKTFVCCVTKKYSDSKNCENELCFAYDSNKKIIAIMFEKVTLGELMGVGLILARLLRINAFDEGKFPFNVESERFKELLIALRPDKLTSSNNLSTEIASSSKQNSKKKKECKNGFEKNDKNQTILDNQDDYSDISLIYQRTYYPQNSVLFHNGQHASNFYSNYGVSVNQINPKQFNTGQPDNILVSIKDKFKSLAGKNNTGTTNSPLNSYFNYNPYQLP